MGDEGVVPQMDLESVGTIERQAACPAFAFAVPEICGMQMTVLSSRG